MAPFARNSEEFLVEHSHLSPIYFATAFLALSTTFLVLISCACCQKNDEADEDCVNPAERCANCIDADQSCDDCFRRTEAARRRSNSDDQRSPAARDRNQRQRVDDRPKEDTRRREYNRRREKRRAFWRKVRLPRNVCKTPPSHTLTAYGNKCYSPGGGFGPQFQPYRVPSTSHEPSPEIPVHLDPKNRYLNFSEVPSKQDPYVKFLAGPKKKAGSYVLLSGRIPSSVIKAVSVELLINRPITSDFVFSGGMRKSNSPDIIGMSGPWKAEPGYAMFFKGKNKNEKLASGYFLVDQTAAFPQGEFPSIITPKRKTM